MGSPERGRADFYRLGLLMMGVATSYPVLVLGGALLGQHLDRRAGTEPWLLAAGFLLGGAACVVETWAVLRIWRGRSD